MIILKLILRLLYMPLLLFKFLLVLTLTIISIPIRLGDVLCGIHNIDDVANEIRNDWKEWFS